MNQEDLLNLGYHKAIDYVNDCYENDIRAISLCNHNASYKALKLHETKKLKSLIDSNIKELFSINALNQG